MAAFPRSSYDPNYSPLDPVRHEPQGSTPVQQRLLPTTSDARKRFPMARGLLDYFPDALAAVAEVSWIGNEKHNPGKPIHWARGKSMDHDDCIIRHTVERGGFEEVKVNGVTYHIRHSAARAWRALAALQEELEAEYKLAAPRGAKYPAA